MSGDKRLTEWIPELFDDNYSFRVRLIYLTCHAGMDVECVKAWRHVTWDLASAS